MTRSPHHPLLFVAILLTFSAACGLSQPEPDPGEFNEQVATSVEMTLTALSTNVPPTDTPLPTATETTVPTVTATPLPTLPPTTTPTVRPAYACSITEQRPRDDTVFERFEDFDVRWTLVNTGTQRWPRGTYLEYLSGPRMTEVTSRELPRLQPGEDHEIILDAAAPEDLERQVMVWAVYGLDEDDDEIVLCYPYVRIIVER